LRERVARLPASTSASAFVHPNNSREEAGDYLRHRLKAMDIMSGDLFPPDAVDRATSSQGVPRG
jgi:hypothetical protein